MKGFDVLEREAPCEKMNVVHGRIPALFLHSRVHVAGSGTGPPSVDRAVPGIGGGDDPFGVESAQDLLTKAQNSSRLILSVPGSECLHAELREVGVVAERRYVSNPGEGCLCREKARCVMSGPRRVWTEPRAERLRAICKRFCVDLSREERQ
jgi:hypothetical protein